MPLNDFLKTFTTTSLKNSKPIDSLFYCFEDNQLVGAILLGNTSFIPSIYYIDYLAVNPKLHNKGYGTRMIKSAISNPDFFNNGTAPKLYISHSAITNVESSRVFIKNKFKLVRPSNIEDFPFYDFYFTPRTNVKE